MRLSGCDEGADGLVISKSSREAHEASDVNSLSFRTTYHLCAAHLQVSVDAFHRVQVRESRQHPPRDNPDLTFVEPAGRPAMVTQTRRGRVIPNYLRGGSCSASLDSRHSANSH